MIETIARCLGMSGGIACVEPATCLAPVPLCTPHRMEVAVGIVPQMLERAAGQALVRTPVVLTVEQTRLVQRARAVAPDWKGGHAARVYFVEHGNRVKIGYTTNLRERLSALSLRPDNLVILLAGGLDLERALHAHFDALRIGETEWFRDAADLRRYVREHRQGAVLPDQARPELETGEAPGDLLAAIVRAIGQDRGVHLATLLPHVEHLGIPDRTVLRARLDEEGVPVRRTLRTSEGPGRTGIHRDDVATLLRARAKQVQHALPAGA